MWGRKWGEYCRTELNSGRAKSPAMGCGWRILAFVITLLRLTLSLTLGLWSCANVIAVNKKLLVKDVFIDEASGDEM